MATSVEVGDHALGRRLADLRESAGLDQAQLARQVALTQAVLADIESGKRSVNATELDELLGRIGTAEADALRGRAARDWVHLPPPAVDHADHDLLWAAEQVAAALHLQAQGPNLRPAFLKRLQEYRDDIDRTAEQLRRRDHNVAFVGAIGIGKSTAICKVTGLEVQGPNGNLLPVLETGAGGITLCEVSLTVGPGYGVIVTPQPFEETRADVADFADLLLTRGSAAAPGEESVEVQKGIPRELERAIRNLSDLRPTRSKGADGKLVRSDPAVRLAEDQPNARELTVEILSRMELHRRDRREAWYDPSSNQSELA